MRCTDGKYRDIPYDTCGLEFDRPETRHERDMRIKREQQETWRIENPMVKEFGLAKEEIEFKTLEFPEKAEAVFITRPKLKRTDYTNACSSCGKYSCDGERHRLRTEQEIIESVAQSVGTSFIHVEAAVNRLKQAFEKADNHSPKQEHNCDGVNSKAVEIPLRGMRFDRYSQQTCGDVSNYDAPKFKVGDKVWCSCKTESVKGIIQAIKGNEFLVEGPKTIRSWSKAFVHLYTGQDKQQEQSVWKDGDYFYISEYGGIEVNDERSICLLKGDRAANTEGGYWTYPDPALTIRRLRPEDLPDGSWFEYRFKNKWHERYVKNGHGYCGLDRQRLALESYGDGSTRSPWRIVSIPGLE